MDHNNEMRVNLPGGGCLTLLTPLSGQQGVARLAAFEYLPVVLLVVLLYRWYRTAYRTAWIPRGV
eukprot:365057-Chlamydomonas_euryale.AAC.19